MICPVQRTVKRRIAAGWEQTDREITARLNTIGEEKGSVVLLTPTIFSPSMEAVIGNS